MTASPTEETEEIRWWSRVTVGVSRVVDAGLGALRDARWRGFRLRAAFVTVLGFGLGYAGPFGTYVYLPTLTRVLYWGGLVLGAWLMWSILSAIFGRLRTRSDNEFANAALIAGPFCALGALVTLLLSAALTEWTLDEAMGEWSDAFASWMIVALGVVTPLIALGRAIAHESKSRWGEGLFGFLMQRLPAKIRGGDLIALKAEDHYVRVYTTAGDDLVLMRFEDAIAALEGYPGAQTHRSWWVSARAVERVERQPGGVAEVVLNGGLTAPVSRRRKGVLASLQEQGGAA